MFYYGTALLAAASLCKNLDRWPTLVYVAVKHKCVLMLP